MNVACDFVGHCRARGSELVEFDVEVCVRVTMYIIIAWTLDDKDSMNYIELYKETKRVTHVFLESNFHLEFQ